MSRYAGLAAAKQHATAPANLVTKQNDGIKPLGSSPLGASGSRDHLSSSKDLLGGKKPGKLARAPTFARLEHAKSRPISMPNFHDVDESMQHDDIDEDHYLDGTQSERAAARSWSISGGFREPSFKKKKTPDNSLKKPAELTRKPSAVGFAAILTYSGWKEDDAQEVTMSDLGGSGGLDGEIGRDEGGVPSHANPTPLETAPTKPGASRAGGSLADSDDEGELSRSKSFKSRRACCSSSEDDQGGLALGFGGGGAAALASRALPLQDERAMLREREEMLAHQNALREGQMQQQAQLARLETLLSTTATQLATLAAQQSAAMLMTPPPPSSTDAPSPPLVAPSPPVATPPPPPPDHTIQQRPPELPPVMWGLGLGDACFCVRNRRAAKPRGTSSAFETPLLGGLLRYYHLSAE